MKMFYRTTIVLCILLAVVFFAVGPAAAAGASDKGVSATNTVSESSSTFDWLTGTVWEIRDFDGRTAKERADNGKWIFKSSNKVGAYVPLNYWNGDWKQLTNDRIQVNIGSNNAAELIFINQQYFIAIDHTSKNFRYTGEKTTK
jgi:hypothetical protein